MQSRTCAVLLCMLCAAPFLVINGCAGIGDKSAESIEVPILQQWSGDYPVDHLGRLSQAGQRRAVGYIVEASAFAAVWQVFKPIEAIPTVNFGKHLIVYYRNVEFYNRISIAKIILKGDDIEILARETLSSRPIEDKVALSMAVVPRSGIPRSLQRAKSGLPFRFASIGR
ncbi:MAG: hypothetical protein VR64_18005 [Desulfatitalea sp. BRH_c12]|nr:MAG: hypothetical protein VR64_18005 [Desulfatitalea sp. BRH_c12]